MSTSRRHPSSSPGHRGPSRPKRLPVIIGAVWLSGVLFVVAALAFVLGAYSLEQRWYQRQKQQAQQRLQQSWKALQQRILRTKTTQDGIVGLRFSATGQLLHPLHLAPPMPPVSFALAHGGAATSAKASWLFSADHQAQALWEAAIKARKGGDIAGALAALAKIPKGTYAANGLPLDLLAAYKRWQLNEPKATPLLLRQLRQKRHPVQIRRWLLRQLQQQPQLRPLASTMLQALRRDVARWRGLTPPQSGTWRRHRLGGRDGIVASHPKGKSAWLSLQVVEQATAPAWRPLQASGRVATAISFRPNPAQRRQRPGTASCLVAGPIQLTLTPTGWLQPSVVWGAAGVIGCVLVLLVLAGGVMRRLYLTEQALLAEQQRFAAAVTHELRSPLTSLALTSELLASGDVPEDRLPNYHQRLTQQTTRLQGVVNNVIAHYRGQRPQREARCDLHDIVKEFEESIAPMLERAGITLHVTYHDTAQPLPMSSDALSRILHNLTDNAFRHAPGSDIAIKVGPGLSLAFSDQGPGIPKAQHDAIFQPYTQGPQRGDKRQGLGLGLSLVRDEMTSAGGTITLRSTPHDGTTFLLTWEVSDD